MPLEPTPTGLDDWRLFNAYPHVLRRFCERGDLVVNAQGIFCVHPQDAARTWRALAAACESAVPRDGDAEAASPLGDPRRAARHRRAGSPARPGMQDDHCALPLGADWVVV